MPNPKKAQRTKGNVKPSSSSQAALLLAASGQAPAGFMGFSHQPAFVPASETFDDAESMIDDDFRLVLRKFSKRDTVTKIKALQEFISLCNSKNEECIKAMVPFWPRVYIKVAIDVDHKVRELSQKALVTLAAKAGKSLAPHLKSIMGAWMISMYDTYPTVASAANAAFTNTFSEAKQIEAVRFCKMEITECLMNYILQQTPRTLSDPLTTSEEDMESKYQRVVSSSFQAFSKLLQMLPADSVSDSMLAHLTRLTDSHVFWKLAKLAVPQIQCGVLSLLSATCQLCPEASSKAISKVAPFIFSCLDSTDPNVVSHTWEAVLSLISAHEDCWQYVSWQKAVGPKIKKVLENGCFGQAAIVCPCLLPLLSKIPNINLTHFFDSFRLGLRKDSVLNSPLDMSALVQSFLECIQYGVKRLTENGDSNAPSEIRSLLLSQVLVIVQTSLTDSKPGLSKTELYARLCPLLSAVAKIDGSIESVFWSELSSFVQERLVAEFTSADKNIQDALDKTSNEPVIFQRLRLLFEGMIFQQTAACAKVGRVQFASEEYHSQKKPFFDKEKQDISETAGNFVSDMFVIVFRLASIKEHTAPLFFSLFKDLSLIHVPAQAAERLNSRNDHLAELVASELGTKLERNFYAPGEDDSSNVVQSKLVTSESERSDAFSSFLCGELMGLLLYAQSQGEENRQMTGQFTDDVIMSLFAFVAYVDHQEGARILFDVCNSVTKPQVTCQFIEHLLDCVKVIPACRPLVAGTQLAGKIEKLTMSATVMEKDGVSRDVWRMLTSVVVSLDESDSHLFSQSCMDAIMSSCVTTLLQLQLWDANQRVDNLVCVVDLVHALLSKHQISMHSQLGELVLSLLTLLMKAELAEQETLWKLRSCWLSGLRIILCKKSDAEIQQFVGEFCAVVKQWVQSNVHTHESLAGVGKIIRVSLQTIAVPSIESLDDDRDLIKEPDSITVGDEVDVVTLGAALDHLLMTDSTELDCLMEAYEYLYIDGSLDSLPQSSQPPETAHLLSPQAYLVKVVHNLNTLLLKTDLPFCKYLETDPQQAGCHWSEVQLLTMAELCHSLTVLEAARKIKQQEFKEWSNVLLSDLQLKLVKCLKSLNTEQLSLLANLVGQRFDRAYSAYTFSAKSIFQLVSKSQLAEEKPVSASVTPALLSVRLGFIARCIQSEDEVKEVTELLVQSHVSAHRVREAFALACTVVLSNEDLHLQLMSDCITGFLRLAMDYDVLNEEVKLSFFHQITVLVKQLKERNISLLSGSDKSLTSADHSHFNISIIRVLKSLLVSSNDQVWEFTLCALVEWIQFLSKIKLSQTSDAATKALFVSTCKLAYQAAQIFSTATVVKDTLPADSTSFFVTEKAKTEWNEFFSEGLFSLLLPMFVSQASSVPAYDEPFWTLVLLPLASVVSLCPGKLVLAHQLPVCLTTTDKSGLPDNLKTLFNHLCPLLMARQRSVEIAAYKLLSSVIEEVPKYETSSEDEDKQEEELRSPPEALIQHMEAAGHFLDCLMVVHVDDHIEMDTGTNEHAQAMGYLLSWRLLLQLFGCSPNQLRAKYAQYFKATDSVSHLLDHLFRLIPQHPSQVMLELTASELSVQDEEIETELSSLALHVYRGCLDIVPALVRTWWVNQDRKSSNFVDRFTTQYLSSGLIWQQITSAQSTNTIDGILIRARPAAREVYATCEMAEVTVNMTITLPENYPLGKLDVACDKRVGVSQSQWDRWLLQLNIFLQHQNGSIVEGLRLWKGNIDKKFEGIEDCMVCFCVIHGTTFQLPRLTCKTCRKKFHSACLYKWFSTAQKSTCPLCRNVF